MEINKITAIALTILWIGILALTSVELISTKLFLPPYSFETEEGTLLTVRKFILSSLGLCL